MSDAWGTIPQWISTFVAMGALWIAWKASAAWLKTLTAKRRDDLLLAAHDLAGEIGKLTSAIDLRVTESEFGSRVDDLYASLRELTKVYAVAQGSYRPYLPDSVLDALRNKVNAMRDAARALHVDQSQSNASKFADFGTKSKEASVAAAGLCETASTIGSKTFPLETAADATLSRWTAVVGVFTAFLAAVGGLQVWAFIQSERASLLFEIATFRPYPLSANQPLWVQVNVSNTGRSDAFIVDEKIAMHIDKHSLPINPDYPASAEYRARGSISSGRQRQILIGPTDRMLTESEVSAIQSGQLKFYIYGYAKFRDEFTLFGPKEIGFCVAFNPNDPSQTPSPRLDDCDNPNYVYSR